MDTPVQISFVPETLTFFENRFVPEKTWKKGTHVFFSPPTKKYGT